MAALIRRNPRVAALTLAYLGGTALLVLFS